MPPARVGVGGEDVGHLQTGQVEGLAGRRAGHRVLTEPFVERGEGSIAESRHDQFAVDLVGDDEEVVAQADLADAPQLVGRPDPAGGVVGVAQQHEFHRRVGRTALEVLEVDAVAVAVEHQVALLGRAAAVGNGDVKVVVDRRLDQHLVSRTGHGPQNGRKGGDDARHRVDPLPLGRPSVATQKPAPDRLGIGLGRYGVAVDAVLDPPAQRLDDRRGRAEIHVGDPHGQHAVGYPVVPFHGAGAPPGDDLIEIEMFHICMHAV